MPCPGSAPDATVESKNFPEAVGYREVFSLSVHLCGPDPPVLIDSLYNSFNSKHITPDFASFNGFNAVAAATQALPEQPSLLLEES